MYIVTNTIRVKNGFGDELTARFKETKAIQQFEGFVRLELWRTEGLIEFEELKVCTTWENKESFEAWFKSDSFKKAHSGKKGKSDNVLGSEVHKYEVVVEHSPATTVAAE
jgi:heme oxygenase (staphylobilin-producing)